MTNGFHKKKEAVVESPNVKTVPSQRRILEKKSRQRMTVGLPTKNPSNRNACSNQCDDSHLVRTGHVVEVHVESVEVGFATADFVPLTLA